MANMEITEKYHHSTKEYRGECISFKTTGWWGTGPISFRREFIPDLNIDRWEMSTVSGGQNDVDVLVKIRELRAILNAAEDRIMETRRPVVQEHDGMELIDESCQSMENYPRVDPSIRSINTMHRTVHYVGFRGDEFVRARRIWGGPVMIHRVYDALVFTEVGDQDIVIFGPKSQYTEYVWDASSDV